MRALVGPLGVHVALLAAGFGVLCLLGILREATIWRWIGAIGLAYVCGMTCVLLVAIALGTAGAPFGIPSVGAICALLALPAVRVFRDPPRFVAPPRPRDLEQWYAVVLLAGFAVVVVVGLFAVGLRPVDSYDAWNLWVRKAALLFWESELPGDIFRTRAYTTSHPDYPLLVPAFEALHLRGLGRFDPRAVHVPLWLLMGAFVWAGAFLAYRIARPAVWASVLVGAAMYTRSELLTAYADVPMAYLMALAALVTGLWVRHGRRSDLALAAILLAGTAATKNEGLVGTFVIVVAAAVAVVGAGQRAKLAELGVATAAVAAVAVVPWRLFLAAHDLKGDISVADAADPSFLADRADRVWPSVEALQWQITVRPGISAIVPVAAALTVLAVRKQALRPLGVFYLAAGFLYFTSLVWAYWVSPLDLDFHIRTSASRVVIGVAFLSLAAVIHLGGVATRRADGATVPPPSTRSPEA